MNGEVGGGVAVLELKPCRNVRWPHVPSSAFSYVNGKCLPTLFSLQVYCWLPYVPEVGIPDGEVIYLKPRSREELASQVSIPR